MKNQKVAIITGAAGGIGRATAHRFAKEDYMLVLSDIDQSGLQELEAELDKVAGSTGRNLALPGDLADLNYVQSLVSACRDQWNRLDVVVNNAVWRTHDTMRTITEVNWEKALRIGLTAPAFLTKWAAALMEKQDAKGTVINISSIQSQRASGTSPAYAACKGALDSLTYELAALYGPMGVRVVGVAPGNTLTSLSSDFTDESGNNISNRLRAYMEDQTAMMRSAQPEEIAHVIHWLSTPEASFVNGAIIPVDGGFSHGFGSYSLKNLQFPNTF